MADITYTKVPGSRGSSAMSYHRLATASDHLIAVSNTWGSETNKRYAFTDIQALVLHRTGAWLVGNCILGAITAFLLLPALGSSDEDIQITFGVIFGIFLIPFVLHLAAGPTVKLYIQTATSHDQLGGIQRLRKARRVIEYLAPLIEQAQNNHEATRTAIAKATAPVPPPLPVIAPPAPAPEPQP